MTSVEHRIALLHRRGVDHAELRADEWLELACQAEQFAKSVGPFDFAFGKFSQDARNFLEAACIAELIGGAA